MPDIPDLRRRRPLAAGNTQKGARHRPSIHANFHEKAHFVKGRRGGLFEVERNGSMSFALCFHPHTLSEPTVRWLGAL